MHIQKLILLIILLVPIAAFSQPHSELLQEADSLHAIHKEEQALVIYQQVLEEDPQHYKALWRSSLLLSRIGNRLEDQDDQEMYYTEAITLAERSLKVDSTDSQANYVMAVAMGRKALIAGARERVEASRAIKRYVDRALEADPSHAGALHVLGRWHFKVANLSWVERTAARTLFGGLPGEASNEIAAESLERAIDLKDDYLLYYYDLALVYEEMGKDQEAMSSCIEMVQMPALRPGDEEIKKDCQKLIQSLR